MKKILTFAMAALVCMSCAAKKPVKQAEPQVPQETETQRKIRELKEQQELEALQAEIELQRMQAEAKKKRLATQIGMEESMIDGDQVLVEFCKEESFDKPGEYMAGLGISRPKKNEQDAKLEANLAAIQDIVTRFMGAIKSGSEYYTQATTTKEGKNMDESQLEGLAMNIVEKEVNKYAAVACSKKVQDNDSMFKYYVAVHVQEGETVNSIAEEMAKQEVVRDKASFKKQLLNQIDADSQKRLEAQERQLQMLKELDE